MKVEEKVKEPVLASDHELSELKKKLETAFAVLSDKSGKTVILTTGSKPTGTPLKGAGYRLSSIIYSSLEEQ